MAVCVAVIGKDNNPLYISCAKQEQVKYVGFMLKVRDERL